MDLNTEFFMQDRTTSLFIEVPNARLICSAIRGEATLHRASPHAKNRDY